MVGLGETYFVAYAIKLGHTDLQASLLATLPMVIGGIFQLVVPNIINFIGSYKIWTVGGAFLQALSFIPLFLESELIKTNYWVLFFIVSVYWIFNLGIGPSWNAWISKIIDKDDLDDFFTKRSFFVSLGSLVGLFVGGYALSNVQVVIGQFSSFSLLFLMGFVLRVLSSLTLATHNSVEYERQELKPMSRTYFAFPNQYAYLKKIVAFVVLFKFGVFFSAGFFSPYMLSVLNMSYLDYMKILGASFVGRMVFNLVAKNMLKKLDLTKVLFYSCMGISTIPLLWVLIQDYNTLLSLEVFTGFLWGGFELAFVLISFREAPSSFQSFYVSYFSFFHVIIGGLGVFLGIITFKIFENQQSVYFIIFILSGGFRLMALTSFPGFKEIRFKENIKMYYRIWAIRPNMGWVQRPSITILNKSGKTKMSFKKSKVEEADVPKV